MAHNTMDCIHIFNKVLGFNLQMKKIITIICIKMILLIIYHLRVFYIHPRQFFKFQKVLLSFQALVKSLWDSVAMDNL